MQKLTEKRLANEQKLRSQKGLIDQGKQFTSTVSNSTSSKDTQQTDQTDDDLSECSDEELTKEKDSIEEY